MSYEAHATMAINCITVSVYTYAVLELIAVCLTMMLITAKNVPPTDFLSFLFNIWFGIMTFAIVMAMRTLLAALFFSDAFKETIKQPSSTTTIAHDDGSGVKYTQYGGSESGSVGPLLFKLSMLKFLAGNAEASQAPPQPEAAKPAEPADPTPAQPKSPGTPDSERSGADTETSGYTEPTAMAKGGEAEGEIRKALY